MVKLESEKYVCAFRGRRDYYQLPLALSEAKLLDAFITDVYFKGVLRAYAHLLPPRLTRKLNFRYEAALPDQRIVCLWRVLLMDQIGRRTGEPEWLTYGKIDRVFSEAVAEHARRTRSHLMLYNPYAWEAFTARYDHTPRKILFQFHPHSEFERNILRKDKETFGKFYSSYRDQIEGRLPQEWKKRDADCWRNADLILCASSFTKDSMTAAGAGPEKCIVVPYGIDLCADVAEISAPESFQVLFVGTGTPRKGVHHLLGAWHRADLPSDSHLTLVCRTIDPEVAALAGRTPRVSVVRGTELMELNELFRRSALLAMPSLVEGFGQVYLEALAQGCPVLGTAATCLPDLGPAHGAVFEVSSGNVDQLVSELERLSKLLPGNADCRREAINVASRWPWIRFRQGVRAAIAAN